MPPAGSADPLSELTLTANIMVDGLYTGRHCAAHRGAGIEFHDYRPYTPGEDPKAIDWKRYARTDRLHLRRFQHHTDLAATLCLDVSASMNFPAGGAVLAAAAGITKLDYARQLAAALAVLLVRQGDRVGLALFARSVRIHLPPAASNGHLRRLLEHLAAAAPAIETADPTVAAGHLLAHPPSRQLVILLSDLLDEPASLFSSLARLRGAGCDVILLQILSPLELDPAALTVGRATLIDPETAARAPVDPSRAAADYRRQLDNHLDAIRRTARAHRIDHHLLSTAATPIESLRRVLIRRSM